MRALWLAPVHYNGGTEVHPAPWISSLAQSLHLTGEVEITILNYQPRLAREKIVMVHNGIEHVFLKTPVPKVDYLTMYRKRIRIMRDYVESRLDEFDLIHVHGSEHQYEAVVHDLDIPVVMSMQGILTEYIKHVKNKNSYTYLSWLLSSRYEKNYISKVKEFMCRTSFDTGFVKKYNPEARVHENWEMLRPEFFGDHFSERPDNILHMGGTNPLKGMSLMLQAFDQVLESSDRKLLLAGKVDESIIEQIILHHDLKNVTMDHIEVLGVLDAKGLAKAFDRSYMLVHPTLIDNSPNSICEAQVAGLPVIATDVGGVSSLIENGRTGLLAPTDPKAIAKRIWLLMDDPDLHTQLSTNSRAMARKRHDPQKIHERTIDIYESILAA